MTRSVLLAASALLTTLTVHRMRRTRRQQRHHHALIDSLPDVVDLLLVLVRAGLTPTQALDESTVCCPPPWAAAFEAVSAARQHGARALDALDQLVAHAGTPAQALVDALAASERFGQPLVPSLERLSLEARLARQRLHDTQARQLPVRLSFPLVLCILPAFGLVTVVPLVAGTLASMRSAGGTP